MAAAREPERSPDAAGEVKHIGIPFVDPRRRHRADQLLEHLGAGAVRVDEGEDHLGVDRHLGLVPGDAVTSEQLVVVLDDPVVDADDAPVANGVVVRRDRRMPLRVVADVDERLPRRRGKGDRVEHRARAGLLLVDGEWAIRADCISDSIRPALGDPGQQCLSRKCSIDLRLVADAVACDSAHVSSSLSVLGEP